MYFPSFSHTYVCVAYRLKHDLFHINPGINARPRCIRGLTWVEGCYGKGHVLIFLSYTSRVHILHMYKIHFSFAKNWLIDWLIDWLTLLLYTWVSGFMWYTFSLEVRCSPEVLMFSSSYPGPGVSSLSMSTPPRFFPVPLFVYMMYWL